MLKENQIKIGIWKLIENFIESKDLIFLKLIWRIERIFQWLKELGNFLQLYIAWRSDIFTF